MCIRLNKSERPTVKELLQLDFFQENTGFKVEFVNEEENVTNGSQKVELRLISLINKVSHINVGFDGI